MGGDSAATDTYLDQTIRAEPKVFRVGSFVYGVSGSVRLSQLLRFAFKPSVQVGKDDHGYLVTQWVDELRQVLKDKGHAMKHWETEAIGGSFLVGYRGGLYEVHSDYQVGRPKAGFAAVGSGGQVALGALFASTDKPPKERIRTALQAAARFNAGVRPPFVILTQPH